MHRNTAAHLHPTACNDRDSTVSDILNTLYSHADSRQYDSRYLRGRKQPCLEAAYAPENTHTPLQHHLCIHEHALVELAPFLKYRPLYLAMPPLDNMQVDTRGGWNSHACKHIYSIKLDSINKCHACMQENVPASIYIPLLLLDINVAVSRTTPCHVGAVNNYWAEKLHPKHI